MEVRQEGVLHRIVDIFACFSLDEPSLTAHEIASRTGIAVSSTHRLLARMHAMGLLDKPTPHTFAISLSLWKIGELAPPLLSLRETALPYMTHLYEATGENVHLAVLEAPDTPSRAMTLYIARVTGENSSPTLLRTGGSFPLHTTGVGKALLSIQDDDWIDRYIQSGLVRETTHSITDGDVLVREIERNRARGYATAQEEMSLGTASVAVVMDSVAFLPAASLGIVTNTQRFREREFAGLVQAAAHDLHRALAGLSRAS